MEGRVIGFMLTLGGLFFYSLLTSTLTANFKVSPEHRACLSCLPHAADSSKASGSPPQREHSCLACGPGV